MKVFSTADVYPFLKPLEEHAETIHSELEALGDKQYTPWSDTHLYDKKEGWRVFGLYNFGTKLKENCACCPETTKLVEGIPGMRTAGFSRLMPGTIIKLHWGWNLGVLRCHLGLTLSDNCGIKVAGKTAAWKRGKCIVFDDTLEHEAWNKGTSERIVLLVDFKKDPAQTSLFEMSLELVIKMKYHASRLVTHLLSFFSGGGSRR